MIFFWQQFANKIFLYYIRNKQQYKKGKTVIKKLPQKRKAAAACAALLFSLSYQTAHADAVFAGFGSIAYSKAFSDSEEGAVRDGNPAAMSREGEYRDMNKLGLQLDTDLKDNLSFTVQMVASGWSDYDPEFDWIYASYRFSPEWSISIGKTRTPLYLYSDTLDVAYSYIWTSTPDAVYSSSLIKSLEGINITYYDHWGDWSALLQMYAGTDEQDFDNGYRMELDNAAGITFTTNYDDWITLRATYYLQQISLEVNDLDLLFQYGPGVINGFQIGGLDALGSSIGVNFSPVVDDLFMENKQRKYASIGANIDIDQLFFITEARHSDTESNMFSEGTDGAYFTIGGRLPHKVTLAATYGQRKGKKSDYDAVEQYNRLTESALNTAFGTGDFETITKIMTWEGVIEGMLDRLEQKHEEIILTARWDFHSKAAFKLEHVRAKDESHSGGETLTSRPYGWTVSLDLVF